jgi:hypothetical protein
MPTGASSSPLAASASARNASVSITLPAWPPGGCRAQPLQGQERRAGNNLGRAAPRQHETLPLRGWGGSSSGARPRCRTQTRMNRRANPYRAPHQSRAGDEARLRAGTCTLVASSPPHPEAAIPAGAAAGGTAIGGLPLSASRTVTADRRPCRWPWAAAPPPAATGGLCSFVAPSHAIHRARYARGLRGAGPAAIGVR